MWTDTLKRAFEPKFMDCPKCKKEGRDPPGKLRILKERRHYLSSSKRGAPATILQCDHPDCDYKERF